jgi:hypothetical protein
MHELKIKESAKSGNTKTRSCGVQISDRDPPAQARDVVPNMPAKN